MARWLVATLVITFGSSPPGLADECPDAWITTKIKIRLMGKAGLGAFKINVDTEQCMVTLLGCVDSEEQEARAIELSRKIKKVKGVQNQLTRCPPEEAEAAGAVADQCPDAVITSEVKSLLLANQGFKAFKINVETEECVVTLEGCVETGKQEREAVKLARKAKGARMVKSHLGRCPSE